ncbi:MAG: aspartate ammonia-lyase, partial [Acidobacteria bacterium]|nr:aspartate ammonia-lyase [Acidobacteriota bacterium]
MLPVIAYNLLQSIDVLSGACRVLADSAVAGFSVNQKTLDDALQRNPILVTALNPVIGYEKGAAIAKQAYA